VGFALVVLEEHARRAMQLRNDHTFCAVDHERTVVGHQRNFAEVNVLFLDFLDGRLGRFAIHDDQTHARAQRGGKGDAALLTLDHIKRGLAQHVVDKLKSSVLVVRHNRENRSERCLQADVATGIRLHTELQEFRIGIDLRSQQERHFEHARPLRKALANTFLLSERVFHTHKLSME